MSTRTALADGVIDDTTYGSTAVVGRPDGPAPHPHQSRPAAPTAADIPGRHIVADFTPPDLVTARRVKKVRVYAILTVLLVAVVVAATTVWATARARDSAAALAAANHLHQSLQDQQQQYGTITALRTQIAAAQQQLATVMGSDVDADALLDDVWQALPNGMTISAIDVTIPAPILSTTDGTGAAATTGSDAGIGTVVLSGGGTRIDDLPAFIDRLRGLDGVADPFPVSNEVAGDGTAYSLRFTLTEARLSHHFDVTEEGH